MRSGSDKTRAQQDGINNAEDCCIHTDSQCQRDDSDRGKTDLNKLRIPCECLLVMIHLDLSTDVDML